MSITPADVVVTVTGPDTVEVTAANPAKFVDIVAHAVEHVRPTRRDGVRVSRGWRAGTGTGTRLHLPRSAAESLGWIAGSAPAAVAVEDKPAPKKRAPRRKATPKTSAESDTPDADSAGTPAPSTAEGDTAAADQKG